MFPVSINYHKWGVLPKKQIIRNLCETILDMDLSRQEFATTVAIQLGVDVMEVGVPCGFCG